MDGGIRGFIGSKGWIDIFIGCDVSSFSTFVLVNWWDLFLVVAIVVAISLT